MLRITATVWVFTLVLLLGSLTNANPQRLTGKQADGISGRDVHYCWGGACDAYASTCDDDADCFGNAGDQCGNYAEPTYAEVCQADFGNAYCDPGSTQAVCAVCAEVFLCTCNYHPPAGGVPGRYSCDAYAVSTGFTHANITTDPLTCQYPAGTGCP